jgi:hypothetical protein
MRLLNKRMNYKDIQHSQLTDSWLKKQGVNVAHIYAGSAELFQATKLATSTLRQHGQLLAQNQADTLNSFLATTRNFKKRSKITQGQCYRVMNIAKQAQRLNAKQSKVKH